MFLTDFTYQDFLEEVHVTSTSILLTLEKNAEQLDVYMQIFFLKHKPMTYATCKNKLRMNFILKCKKRPFVLPYVRMFI